MFLPALAVLAYVGLDIYFAREGAITSGSAPFFGVVALCLAARMVARLAHPTKAKVERTGTPGFLPIAVLAAVAWEIATVFWAADPSIVVRIVALKVLLIGSAVVVALLVSRSSRTVVRGSLLLALGATGGGIVADVVWPNTFSEMATRAAGFAENPNQAALTLALLVLALFRVIDRTYLRLAVLGVAAVLAFLTLSRGGLLLFALILAIEAVATLNAIRKGRQPLMPAVWAACLVGSIGAFAAWKATDLEMFQNLTTLNRLARIAGQSSFVDQDESRFAILREYLGAWADKPVLGWGSGFIDQEVRPFASSPHNLFLRIAVEQGLVGLALNVLVFIFLVRGMMIRGRIEPLQFVVVIGVACLLTHNLTENRAFYFTIGVLLGRARAERRQISAAATGSTDIRFNQVRYG